MPVPGDGFGRAAPETANSRGKSAPGRTRVADGGGQSWLPPLTPAVGERTLQPDVAAAEQEKQNRLLFTKVSD